MTSYLRYQKELRTVQDADDIESWITVRGNHIPIKKGQSKEEAVKLFLENKGGSASKSETPKTESSKKWSGAWSKRANKPVTVGEASKNATSISKMTKMSASERNENVGYPMLEIANSDVKFTSDPEKNRSALSKAIKESGHENADLMQSVLSNLSGNELKDADSVRKGIRDYMKSYNKKKTTDSWHRLWGKK